MVASVRFITHIIIYMCVAHSDQTIFVAVRTCHVATCWSCSECSPIYNKILIIVLCTFNVCVFILHMTALHDAFCCLIFKICMGYLPSVRSRWLDIGQVLLFFACLWTKTESRSINSQKKNEANIQQS